MNVRPVFALLLVTAGTWAGQALGATAGVVQFAAGDVRIIVVGGSERPASKGSPVDVGDTIATAKASMAQLKMGDGGIVVVQPESRVTVAEYHYTGAEDGTEKVQFRLEQGGMRALTGAIGHTHKANYSIDTPIAHIGVRGTDHETYYFPAGRPSEEGAAPGVYNKVNTGMTFIRTEGGEVDIPPNQVGYAASAHDLPKLLTAVPDFFNRAIQPRVVQLSATQVAGAQAPAPGASAGSPGRSAEAQSSAGNTTAVGVGRGVTQAVVTREGLNLSDPHFASLAGATVPQGGMGVAFGRSIANPAIASNGATLANSGGDAAFGVNWGSWQGGVATVNGAATSGSTNFINSIQPTSATELASLGATAVTATYNSTAGLVSDQLGQQGTAKLSAVVNFGTQQITNYSLAASAGSGSTATSWNASGNGSISQFTGTSGIKLTGTCTGCTPATTANPNGGVTALGTANGAFVGSAAQKMITSFGLSAANKAIAGVGYLTR